MAYYILFGLALIVYVAWSVGKNDGFSDVERRIAKIRDLRDRNVITQEEYEAMRKKLIGL